MTLSDTIINAQFIVKSNGKTYDFELGYNDEEGAIEEAYALISENPEIYEYLKNEYGYTADSESDVDSDMIEELVSYSGLVDFNCESIEFGDGSIFANGELGFDGFDSYADAMDYLESCETCTDEDADKFYAMIEVAGTFNNLDPNDFDNVTLIQANDEEELGHAIIDMGFYDEPENTKYFDYEALGNDMVQGGDFVETSYGYLSTY